MEVWESAAFVKPEAQTKSQRLTNHRGHHRAVDAHQDPMPQGAIGMTFRVVGMNQKADFSLGNQKGMVFFSSGHSNFWV